MKEPVTRTTPGGPNTEGGSEDDWWEGRCPFVMAQMGTADGTSVAVFNFSGSPVESSKAFTV